MATPTNEIGAPPDEPIEPEENYVTVQRLTEFVRKHQHGGCKILSLGDDCQCPLCDLGRITAERDALQSRLEAAERANAAMRIALERAQLWIDEESASDSCCCSSSEHCSYCTKGTAASLAVARALKLDTGHDYIPREEHERVQAEQTSVMLASAVASAALRTDLERVVRERDEALLYKKGAPSQLYTISHERI